MSERLHRTQVLIEPQQHTALAELAAREGRSISEIIREIVRDYLANRSEELRWQGRMQALEGARRLRESIREAYGGRPLDADIAALIREMREARAEQLLSTFSESGDEGGD